MNTGTKIFLLLSFLLALSEIGESRKAITFKKATRGWRPFDKTFLKTHHCKVKEPPKFKVHNNIGFARWTDIVFKCKDLQQNIPSVACNNTCFHPGSCERLKHLKVVPITFSFVFTDRANNSTSVNIPVACQCVTKKSKKNCFRDDSQK